MTRPIHSALRFPRPAARRPVLTPLSVVAAAVAILTLPGSSTLTVDLWVLLARLDPASLAGLKSLGGVTMIGALACVAADGAARPFGPRPAALGALVACVFAPPPFAAPAWLACALLTLVLLFTPLPRPRAAANDNFARHYRFIDSRLLRHLSAARRAPIRSVR